MMRYECDCATPTPHTDSDGDVVCQVCKRVLRTGPLGVNGLGFGGIRSYTSSYWLAAYGFMYFGKE